MGYQAAKVMRKLMTRGDQALREKVYATSQETYEPERAPQIAPNFSRTSDPSALGLEGFRLGADATSYTRRYSHQTIIEAVEPPVYAETSLLI